MTCLRRAGCQLWGHNDELDCCRYYCSSCGQESPEWVQTGPLCLAHETLQELYPILAEGIKRMGIFISDFGVTLADACQRLSDAMAAAITSYPDWPHRHHAACWLKCDAGRPE